MYWRLAFKLTVFLLDYDFEVSFVFLFLINLPYAFARPNTRNYRHSHTVLYFNNVPRSYLLFGVCKIRMVIPSTGIAIPTWNLYCYYFQCISMGEVHSHGQKPKWFGRNDRLVFSRLYSEEYMQRGKSNIWTESIRSITSLNRVQDQKVVVRFHIAFILLRSEVFVDDMFLTSWRKLRRWKKMG